VAQRRSAVISAVFHGADSGWSGAFAQPRAVFSATEHHGVANVIAHAERAAHDGYWSVLLLAYEAAPAMDAAMHTHAPGAFPLAWAAVFDHRAPAPPLAPAELPAPPWTPLVSRAEYERAVQRILAYIAAGDTYQVNYTFPMTCRAPGDLAAWYATLCAAQGAPYSCRIELPDHAVMCLSPELFFSRRGDVITARPMKGTMPRGRWWDEDAAQRDALARCKKNRAENLMIVDMLRNDVGRVAQFGSVHVPALFTVEPYHTVLQMTTTVEARLQPHTPLCDIMRALFPCASITGAPKIRTMDIIRELEPQPRGLYTGTIGLLQPGGDCVFTVAIRTIVCSRRTGTAVFSVGGGIVADSTPAGEYDECAVKAAFLHTRRPVFDLLESLLLDDGRYWLLDEHLARMRDSARYFGYAYDEAAVRRVLAGLARAHACGRFKARLLLAPDGEVRAEAQPLTDLAQPCVAGIAPAPVSSRDVFLFHKTTHRAVYDAAVRACPPCDDVVLWNEDGDITESTRANIVLELDGQRVTPPRACGLLAGTLRAKLLAEGALVERRISRADLARARHVWLINSVRGWMEVDLPHLRAALALQQQTRDRGGAV